MANISLHTKIAFVSCSYPKIRWLLFTKNLIYNFIINWCLYVCLVSLSVCNWKAWVFCTILLIETKEHLKNFMTLFLLKILMSNDIKRRGWFYDMIFQLWVVRCRSGNLWEGKNPFQGVEGYCILACLNRFGTKGLNPKKHCKTLM